MMSKQDGSGGGTTVSVTPGTIARMAGNIAAGMVAIPAFQTHGGEPQLGDIAVYAVRLARLIVAEVVQP